MITIDLYILLHLKTIYTTLINTRQEKKGETTDKQSSMNCVCNCQKAMAKAILQREYDHQIHVISDTEKNNHLDWH